jgi:hypothetical protein
VIFILNVKLHPGKRKCQPIFSIRLTITLKRFSCAEEMTLGYDLQVELSVHLNALEKVLFHQDGDDLFSRGLGSDLLEQFFSCSQPTACLKEENFTPLARTPGQGGAGFFQIIEGAALSAHVS